MTRLEALELALFATRDVVLMLQDGLQAAYRLRHRENVQAIPQTIERWQAAVEVLRGLAEEARDAAR